MNMKRFFISVTFLLISTSHIFAEQNISSNETLWERLIPDYSKIQFAGSIGVVSKGAGWLYGGKEQFDTDISLGFVPNNSIIDAFAIATIKSSYSPWSIPIMKNLFSITPLSCGMFITYATGDGFWLLEPSKYNPPYYRFSTRVRGNLHIGQRLTYNTNSKRVKSLSAYYELSSCDLKIISAATNSYLKPSDYLSFAIGFILRLR